MKRLKFMFLITAFFATAMMFSSCGSNDASSSTDKEEQQGKEYTSAYICPMHCAGSGSEEAGTCPVCNMEYIANADYKAEEAGHEGHNH